MILQGIQILLKLLDYMKLSNGRPISVQTLINVGDIVAVYFFLLEI